VRFQQWLDVLRSEVTARLGGILGASMSQLFVALEAT